MLRVNAIAFVWPGVSARAPSMLTSLARVVVKTRTGSIHQGHNHRAFARMRLISRLSIQIALDKNEEHQDMPC